MIYLVNRRYPTSQIMEVEAALVKTIRGKFTWIEVGKKRFLVGCTAFYTKPAAERAKFGYLTLLVNSSYARIHLNERWQEAGRQIKQFTANGCFEEPELTPARARKFLYRMGIITKSGKLSKNYR